MTKSQGAGKLTKRQREMLEESFVVRLGYLSSNDAPLDHVTGLTLEELELVKWIPGRGYAITDAGRAALKTGGE